MDHRIMHRGVQRFVGLARRFDNDTRLDESGGSIPAFWDECRRQGQLDCLQRLCPAGQKDLYGLCIPGRQGGADFTYCIGVLWDAQTDPAAKKLLCAGYQLTETAPSDYAVFCCMGTDAARLDGVWERFYREFCPQTGYVRGDGADYEVYREQAAPGMFCEVWVPVRRQKAE